MPHSKMDDSLVNWPRYGLLISSLNQSLFSNMTPAEQQLTENRMLMCLYLEVNCEMLFSNAKSMVPLLLSLDPLETQTNRSRSCGLHR